MDGTEDSQVLEAAAQEGDEQQQQEPQEAAPAAADVPAKRKKATTAYFIFTETHRAAVREELLASKEPGGKVAVTDVAKELGRRWKELSDEQRADYKLQCAAAAQQAGDSSGDEAGDKQKEPGSVSKKKSKEDASLPLASVKRIMVLDAELSRVSNDALVVMAHAAELFAGLLGERCGRNMTTSKPRRTIIKLSDFEQVVKQDRRLVQAGLKDVASMAKQRAAAAATAAEAKAAAGAEARASQPEERDGEGGEEEGATSDKEDGGGQHKAPRAAGAAGGKGGKQAAGKQKQPGKRKAEQPAIVTKPITAFFRPAPA